MFTWFNYINYILILNHTINDTLPLCHLLANFVLILLFTLHAANRMQAGDDCCKAAPPIMVVHLLFCLSAKNAGHLHERPIVTRDMLGHVTREEANPTRQQSIPSHDSPKLQQSPSPPSPQPWPAPSKAWPPHLAPTPCHSWWVLFAWAALVACLSADVFNNNAGRMKYHCV